MVRLRPSDGSSTTLTTVLLAPASAVMRSAIASGALMTSFPPLLTTVVSLPAYTRESPVPVWIRLLPRLPTRMLFPATPSILSSPAPASM